MEVFGFIYMTVNLVNNKKYVGRRVSHINNPRLDKKYLGSGTALKNAIREFGRDSFKKLILEECFSYDELVDAEKKWIDQFDAVNSMDFYNLTRNDTRYSGNDPVVTKKVWDSRSAEQIAEIGKKISDTRKRKGLKSSNVGWTSEQVKAIWNSRDEQDRKKIGSKVSASKIAKGVAKGEKNPMFGRSAITEQKLRWYNNGVETKYFSEGMQPIGWIKGRLKKNKEQQNEVQ
jgi:hypothetical protein